MFALGLALIALAGCGGDSESEAPDEQPAEDPARLGCGEYCQQAGGYGDGEAGQPMLSIDTGGPVEALEDGSVPITFRCFVPTRCEGAVLLISDVKPSLSDASRSDLLVDADSSRTIAVALSDSHSKALQEAGRLKVSVTADLLPTLDTLPVDERGEWRPIIVEELVLSPPAPASP